MTTSNPFGDRPDAAPQTQPPAPGPSPRQAYNIVTDTVGGPNVRLRDNLFQAAATAGGLVLGAVVGWLVAVVKGWNQGDEIGCAIVGAFAGVIVGLFGSGIVLMFYRGV